MFSCYLTRRRIGPYLDGALDERSARRTGTHIAGCATCQREAEELRRLRSLLQTTLRPATEPDWTGFFEGVVRGVEQERLALPGRRARGGWLPGIVPRWAFGGALAAALLISLGLWQLAPSPLPLPTGASVLVTSASTEDPRGTVMVYSTPEQDVAVVWVLGIDD